MQKLNPKIFSRHFIISAVFRVVKTGHVARLVSSVGKPLLNGMVRYIIIIICMCLCLTRTGSAQVKALVGGTLIDGYGGKPLHNSVIIIEGERIKAIGQVGKIEIPKNAEIISTEGMSVLPGLWDMHVHLMINGHSDYAHWDKTYLPLLEKVIMPASAHQLLLAGITSARDLGAPLEASIKVRDRINRGEIPGPTMYMSGPFIQKKPYPAQKLFAGV